MRHLRLFYFVLLRILKVVLFYVLLPTNAAHSASVQTGISRATPGTPTFFSKKSAFILVTITVSLDTAGYPRRTVSATSYPALPHSHVHRSLANKCHVKRHFFTDFSPIYPTFDRISRVSVASTQMTRQWDACDLSGLNQAESEK